MVKTKSYPLRIPQNLLELAELKSREEHVDKSTALRHLMYDGAESYIVRLIKEGRLSISKAAELLNRSVLGVYRLIEKEGVKTGSTEAQYQKGKK